MHIEQQRGDSLGYILVIWLDKLFQWICTWLSLLVAISIPAFLFFVPSGNNQKRMDWRLLVSKLGITFFRFLKTKKGKKRFGLWQTSQLCIVGELIWNVTTSQKTTACHCKIVLQITLHSLTHSLTPLTRAIEQAAHTRQLEAHGTASLRRSHQGNSAGYHIPSFTQPRQVRHPRQEHRHCINSVSRPPQCD